MILPEFLAKFDPGAFAGREGYVARIVESLTYFGPEIQVAVARFDEHPPPHHLELLALLVVVDGEEREQQQRQKNRRHGGNRTKPAARDRGSTAI